MIAYVQLALMPKTAKIAPVKVVFVRTALVLKSRLLFHLKGDLMKSFSEWKNTNESALNHLERQDVWNIVHGFAPILKPQIKSLIEKLSNRFIQDEMQGSGLDNRRLTNIAVSQILLDLTREYDLNQ